MRERTICGLLRTAIGVSFFFFFSLSFVCMYDVRSTTYNPLRSPLTQTHKTMKMTSTRAHLLCTKTKYADDDDDDNNDATMMLNRWSETGRKLKDKCVVCGGCKPASHMQNNVQQSRRCTTNCKIPQTATALCFRCVSFAICTRPQQKNCLLPATTLSHFTLHKLHVQAE